jgi:hypothetical protein
MMLMQKRAHARALSDSQQAELARLDEQIDALRARWRVAWGQKAGAEFRSRLTLWKNFMEDYRERPGSNNDRYAYEVNRRVQLHLLAPDADGVPDAESTLLNTLDKFLQAVLIPGSFVWDPELSSAFPQNPFWYLYGTLKKP